MKPSRRITRITAYDEPAGTNSGYHSRLVGRQFVRRAPGSESTAAQLKAFLSLLGVLGAMLLWFAVVACVVVALSEVFGADDRVTNPSADFPRPWHSRQWMFVLFSALAVSLGVAARAVLQRAMNTFESVMPDEVEPPRHRPWESN